MLDEPTSDAATGVLRITQVIVGALATGLILLTGIFLAIRFNSDGGDADATILGLLGLGIMVGSIVVRTAVLRVLQNRSPAAPEERTATDVPLTDDAESPLADRLSNREMTLSKYLVAWQNRKIIGGAMLEGPGILCAILGFIGPIWTFAGTAVCIVWLLATIPTQSSLAQEITASRQLDQIGD